MTRLVFLAAGSLLLALLLCQLETAEAIPQLSPEVKKISILDLFQEEPSLKAELEARLIEKGKKPASVGGGGTPREARTEASPTTTTTTTPTTTTTTTTTTTEAPEASSTTAASEDKQSPRALRTRARPSRTSGPESAVAAAVDTEPAATEEGATTTTDAEAQGAAGAGGPARKLRPQRLTLRRQRPGQAVAASATTEGSGTGNLPEPELEESLVETLVEGSEAEGGPEAKEVEVEPAVPAKKPRARFSLPPRNGAVTGGSAPANKKVEEAPAEEKAGSGLDRLKNARIGGGRFRNSGGRQAPAAPAADEASPAAAADDASAKPLNRLSLAERRSRFSNARTPPTAAAEEAAPEEEETAAAADETAAEEAPAGGPRRNARRFPTLARRNS